MVWDCGNISGIFFLISLCAHARYREHNNSKGKDWLSIHKWQVLAMLWIPCHAFEGDWYCLGVCAVQDVFLTYSAWQEERLKLKEDERKDNVISF